MGKSLNRYIPFCSANQLITYLTLRGLSDAQIRLISGREDWKSVSILTGRGPTGVSGGPSGVSAFNEYPTMPEITILWEFWYLCWNLTLSKKNSAGFLFVWPG
jgi:hypothetical protein